MVWVNRDLLGGERVLTTIVSWLLENVGTLAVMRGVFGGMKGHGSGMPAPALVVWNGGDGWASCSHVMLPCGWLT